MYALTDAISELLEVPITERGVNAMLRCPLHEDDTPSFSVHLEDGVWHCFGCEESGNLDKLYRLLGKEMSDDVILHRAKKRAEEPVIHSQNFASLANTYIRNLATTRGADSIQSFSGPRGIQESAIRAFGIGYEPERDALSFPYGDLSRRVTGIKYRYANGFKASEVGSTYGIYGVEHVVGREQVILCEGESDTLATWSRYHENYGVGGTSGASVRDTQWSRFGLHLLFARSVYLLYDADGPGDKCAATAMSVLGVDKCHRLRPPDGMDATELFITGGRLEDIGLP